jgi:hypothetical protein
MNIKHFSPVFALLTGISIISFSASPSVAGGRVSVELCNNSYDPVSVVLAYSEAADRVNNDFTTGYWNIDPQDCTTASISYNGGGGGIYMHGFFFLDDGDIFAHDPGFNYESFCAQEIQNAQQFTLRGSRARNCSGRGVVSRYFTYLGETSDGTLYGYFE